MITIGRRTLVTQVLTVAVLLGSMAVAEAATATRSCEAQLEQFRHRLAERIEPSFMKERYASALAGAYERCRAGDATAWRSVERILS